jgi:hypothetical protein
MRGGYAVKRKTKGKKFRSALGKIGRQNLTCSQGVSDFKDSSPNVVGIN